jgi:hypothetical protein
LSAPSIFETFLGKNWGMAKKKNNCKKTEKKGPKPDTLKIDEPDWQRAVNKALKKKKPREGWPQKGKTP